jgi:hypothetical protein
MPIINLGQCMSLATGLAGGRNDWTPSEASAWANFALEQVAELAGAHHKSREALAVSSTTSGGNRIAPPTDYCYPLAVTLYVGSNSTATTSRTTSEVPLVQRDARWLDSQTANQAGVPSAYVPYSTWIELYPSPNSAYSLQLRYGANHPTLINSTDTPDLNQRFHQAWVYKTNELLEASRGNPEGEALGRNRYQNYIGGLETDKALLQHDRASMYVTNGRNSRRLR